MYHLSIYITLCDNNKKTEKNQFPIEFSFCWLSLLLTISRDFRFIITFSLYICVVCKWCIKDIRCMVSLRAYNHAKINIKLGFDLYEHTLQCYTVSELSFVLLSLLPETLWVLYLWSDWINPTWLKRTFLDIKIYFIYCFRSIL